MAGKSANKSKTTISIKCCPNCGEPIRVTNSHFFENDDFPAHVQCDQCGVRGPVSAGALAAVEKWNELSSLRKTAEIYKKLSGAESPLEFAVWIKEIRDLAATITNEAENEKVQRKIKEAGAVFAKLAEEIWTIEKATDEAGHAIGRFTHVLDVSDYDKGGFPIPPEIVSAIKKSKNAKRKNP